MAKKSKSKSSRGKTIRVKGYNKSDGTHVKGYTRHVKKK